MRRAFFPVLLLPIALLFSVDPGRAGAPGDVVEVSGFRIDASRASRAQTAETLASLRKQIQMIESANLPADVLRMFRSVPITIDPSLTGMNGRYGPLAGNWHVRAKPGKWPADRAILLHELLHAYHDRVLLPKSRVIEEAHAAARKAGIYPARYQRAYFLSTAHEYFAVIGEVYLVGETFRPPFRCGEVLKSQPQFIEYLASLFGRRECN